MIFKQTTLPATTISPSEAGLSRISDTVHVKVGDLVAIHSRGSYRVARVTRVTKTRVETEYTTVGALKESRRIWEMYTSGSYVATRVRQARESAARNFEFYASEADPATRKYYADGKYDHPQKLAEAIEIAARGKVTYIEDEAEAAQTKAQFEVDEANRRGPEGYLTVTRKTVSVNSTQPVYMVERA